MRPPHLPLLIVTLVAGLAAPAYAAPASVAPTSASPASVADPQPGAPASSTGAGPALPVTSGAADVGPVPGLVATRIHWTRWSTRVVYGGATVLEGQVTTDDGALPSAEVDVYGRRAGQSAWTLLGTTSASSVDGVFRFNSDRPAWTTDYRVAFEGDLVYQRSEGTRHVPVARSLPSTMTSNRDGTYRFSGGISPSYAGRAVKLQRRTSATGTWSTIASTTSSSSSTWRFTVSAPTTTGTWSYRAAVPADSRYTTSYSMTWSLTRR